MPRTGSRIAPDYLSAFGRMLREPQPRTLTVRRSRARSPLIGDLTIGRQCERYFNVFTLTSSLLTDSIAYILNGPQQHWTAIHWKAMGSSPQHSSRQRRRIHILPPSTHGEICPSCAVRSRRRGQCQGGNTAIHVQGGQSNIISSRDYACR